MRNFPDAATVAQLRAYGVRSVVLHTRRALGTPQQTAAASIDGLPLTRSELPGGLIVYELRSPGAGSGSDSTPRGASTGAD
jgi:hypothetical protein